MIGWFPLRFRFRVTSRLGHVFCCIKRQPGKTLFQDDTVEQHQNTRMKAIPPYTSVCTTGPPIYRSTQEAPLSLNAPILPCSVFLSHQALIQRRVTRLRALVLLPSRDLAVQVHDVFRTYARSTGLRVGLAIGHTNFLEEQLALVGGAALAGESLFNPLKPYFGFYMDFSIEKEG